MSDETVTQEVDKDKQIAGYKGQVTKKETEIADLKDRLEDAMQSKGWLFGKRKLIAALSGPVLAILVKILLHYLGIEVSFQELVMIGLLPNTYTGMEGVKDLLEVAHGIDASNNADSGIDSK